MDTRPLGKRGEDLAASHLREQGWEILERNYRSRRGEIDLVCREGDTIVFVEVKARSGTGFARPDQSVTRRKQAKLRRLIEEYRLGHRLEDSDVRFDVLGVTLARKQPRFEHIRGAL
ncbi:YraN family protein [candidate division WOR-3 bacterium]|nr:YraN family protein [candidate division WOR-3 bacterium]